MICGAGFVYRTADKATHKVNLIMKRIVVLLLMILLIRLTGLAQGFEKPPGGKAIVYFVFSESLPAGNAVLYIGDSLIGGFVRNEYTSVVVEPGHHIFKVLNTDPAWMEAEVAVNRTYLVLVEKSPEDNAFPMRFNPVKDGSTRFWRLKKLISAKPPSNGIRGASVNSNDQKFFVEVPALRASHLAKDMDVGKRHLEVPPISH